MISYFFEKTRCFSLVFFMSVGFVAHAEIYEWTDKDGGVHFSGSKSDIPKEVIGSARLVGRNADNTVDVDPEIEKDDSYKDLDVSESVLQELNLALRFTTWTDSGRLAVSELHKSALVVFGEKGHGSGVFITDKYVLTNFHVIKGQKNIKVKNDFESSRAKVVRVNSHRDVALLEVEIHDSFSVPNITNVEPEVGDSLLVIGAPLDMALSNTLTKGVLSSVREEFVGGAQALRFYQTDASINRGNSGGPVFNERSELVAISVSGILTKSGGGLNINYLIPIGDALEHLSIKIQPATVGSYSFWAESWSQFQSLMNHEIKISIDQ